MILTAVTELFKTVFFWSFFSTALAEKHVNLMYSKIIPEMISQINITMNSKYFNIKFRQCLDVRHRMAGFWG